MLPWAFTGDAHPEKLVKMGLLETEEQFHEAYESYKTHQTHHCTDHCRVSITFLALRKTYTASHLA